MYITRIEKGKGQRYRVYSDEEMIFALYRKELQYYHIQENSEIDEDLFHMILADVVLKRAKERALYLLEQRLYTVSMMRKKLLDSEYPELVLEQVLSFLQQYHYLDDREYANMYIKDYSLKKSRKQMIMDLCRRGVDRQILEDFFEEQGDFEDQCFARQFQRYVQGKDVSDFSSRQKIFRHFYSKGFSSELIQKYLKHSDLV